MDLLKDLLTYVRTHLPEFICGSLATLSTWLWGAVFFRPQYSLEDDGRPTQIRIDQRSFSGETTSLSGLELSLTHDASTATVKLFEPDDLTYPRDLHFEKELYKDRHVILHFKKDDPPARFPFSSQLLIRYQPKGDLDSHPRDCLLLGKTLVDPIDSYEEFHRARIMAWGGLLVFLLAVGGLLLYRKRLKAKCGNFQLLCQMCLGSSGMPAMLAAQRTFESLYGTYTRNYMNALWPSLDPIRRENRYDVARIAIWRKGSKEYSNAQEIIRQVLVGLEDQIPFPARPQEH